MAEPYGEEIIEELLSRLEAGEPISAICRDRHMPNRKTVYRWERAGGELGERITESFEIGWEHFAYETMRLVAECADPAHGRNLLASRQWFLGKRSRTFAEKPVVGLAVNVDAGESFAAIAGALEGLASAKSGSRGSTFLVDDQGQARPIDSGGAGLAPLAGDGGPGLGEDEGRG